MKIKNIKIFGKNKTVDEINCFDTLHRDIDKIKLKLSDYGIFYVFTKKYRDEVEMDKVLRDNIDIFKLNGGRYDVNEVAKLLTKKKFENNFEIKD